MNVLEMRVQRDLGKKIKLFKSVASWLSKTVV